MITYMTSAQQLFAVTIGVLLLIFIIELVRRRQLREEYSWLWIVAGTAILIIVAWPQALTAVTAFVGAKTHTTAVFTLGILFLIVVCIHLCSKLSRVDNQLKELAQALAIQNAGQATRPPQKNS